jgi:uncharacterized protein
MIHTFRALGRPMALDVGSGAVHALDELAFRALEQWHTLPREALGALLCADYPKEEVEEVFAELETLEASGALDADDRYEGVSPAEPGVIKAMCLHAAHDCNLRCQYCFASQGDYHDRDRSLMPAETGMRALDWLVAHSGKRRQLEVDFFGGEPLMNTAAIRQIVAHGRELEKQHDKRFQFTLTTNALNLSDETIDFLNREMSNVVLSLDGRPEVHDRMRPTPNGRGSYELAFPKALKLADSRGQQRYYVRGTFTRHNLDFDKDVLHLADQGFEQLSVEPVVADERCEYALTEADLPTILASYDRLAEAYIARRKDGRWFNFFHFMVDLQNGPCLRKRLTGCGAGNEYVAVTPQGDLYPCHQFVGREGYRMGSVFEDAFDRDLQRRFAANHVLAKPACAACWARFYCSGGCAANAHLKNGDIGKPYALECAMERKRLELAMGIVAAEAGAEE